MKLASTLTLLLLLTTAAYAAEKDTLQGAWVAESALAEGKTIKEIVRAVFTFKSGKFEVKTRDGDKMPTGTYEVDVTKSPQQIDLTSKGAGVKELTALAIFKVDGDTLTICAGESSASTSVGPDGVESEPVIRQGPRPPEFDSKHGVLIVLKRKKE